MLELRLCIIDLTPESGVTRVDVALTNSSTSHTAPLRVDELVSEIFQNLAAVQPQH